MYISYVEIHSRKKVITWWLLMACLMCWGVSVRAFRCTICSSASRNSLTMNISIARLIKTGTAAATLPISSSDFKKEFLIFFKFFFDLFEYFFDIYFFIKTKVWTKISSQIQLWTLMGQLKFKNSSRLFFTIHKLWKISYGLPKFCLSCTKLLKNALA